MGIFLGYTIADTLNPNPTLTYTGFSTTPEATYGRMHERGLDFGIYVRQNRWLRWRADSNVQSPMGISLKEIRYSIDIDASSRFQPTRERLPR